MASISRGPVSRPMGFVKFTFALLVVFLAGLIVNATRPSTASLIVPPVDVALTGKQDIAALLSEGLRIPTLSHGDGGASAASDLDPWLAFLQTRFPRAHTDLTLERINTYGLLYTWPGKDPSLAPVVLTAHYDVVHANPQGWTHEPFSGAIADGYVWGRGAMDDKMAVVGLLAAVTELLELGFAPERTVMLAFGHDEEVGGQQGAARIAATLKERGIRPQFVLDEGMPITHGVLAGLKQPAALIGIAEKGFVNIELSAEAPGGHSSAPGAQTAVGIVSAAIARLESNPMPARLDGAVGAMFDRLAPEMPFLNRVVVGNRWLTEPLLKGQLSKAPTTNAMIRTTAAATMFRGSEQANVLPQQAAATVNFRLLPGDSAADVVAHVNKVVDDQRVKVQVAGNGTPASPISSTDSAGFQVIERSIRQVFPEVLVAPALLIATTDTKYYAEIADNIYRFRPIRVTPEDVKRFHGADERIGVENLQEALRFYVQLIRNASGGAVDGAAT